MPNFTFRPAVRQQIPLIIGLAGGTGSGKTFSALLLAKGMSGGEKFALIDTEAGRALHYADQFQFDHGDLHPPFSPECYAEAIEAADDAGYPVIVVDSMSHEWFGDGGVLDMQEAEFAAKNYAENARMSSWVKPKMAHKRFVTRLLQLRAHLILCFRAEPKVEMKREGNRTVVVEKVGAGGFHGWLPVTEKNFPYEMTASFLLMAEQPGVPIPMKLPDALRAYVPVDKPLTSDVGGKLAEWARGGSASSTSNDAAKPEPSEQPANEANAPPADTGVTRDGPERFGSLNDTLDDIKAKLSAQGYDRSDWLPLLPKDGKSVNEVLANWARQHPDEPTAETIIRMVIDQMAEEPTQGTLE